MTRWKYGWLNFIFPIEFLPKLYSKCYSWISSLALMISKLFELNCLQNTDVFQFIWIGHLKLLDQFFSKHCSEDIVSSLLTALEPESHLLASTLSDNPNQFLKTAFHNFSYKSSWRLSFQKINVALGLKLKQFEITYLLKLLIRKCC